MYNQGVWCLCPQVSLVLSALQAGNKGTQACITAASAVSGIIADLDTTIMFASAGTLNAENDESFADHRLELGACLIASVYTNLVFQMWKSLQVQKWLEPDIGPSGYRSSGTDRMTYKLLNRGQETSQVRNYKLPSGFERWRKCHISSCSCSLTKDSTWGKKKKDGKRSRSSKWYWLIFYEFSPTAERMMRKCW